MNDKHGHKRKSGASKLYRIHHNIIQRCTRKKCPAYRYYGGRGIKIYEPWKDFRCFLDEIPPCPGPGYSLDRIDNNKGYFPGNVKWSTYIEQANNKRNNNLITFNGKTQSLAMWSRELGINYFTLKTRLSAAKESPKKALSRKSRKVMTYTYKNHSLSLSEWSNKTGIKRYTLWRRIYVSKWPLKKVFTFRIRPKGFV